MPACDDAAARWAAALTVCLALGGCVHRPRPVVSAPTASPHYVLGGGYRAGTSWYYPAERFEYAESGVATVDSHHRPGLTSDGELYDPQALAGAHQTLQLPAIARVTDLDNGRQIEVRLNDRGPADPKRLIALTPRAGELLDIPAGGSARVLVATDPVLSRALAEQLGGGPHLAIATAPEATVTAEALPPPGSGPAGQPTRLGAEDVAPAAVAVPERMPERVLLVPVEGGDLYIELGRFSRFTYANRRAALLAEIGARVERSRNGRSESYAVRAGPFATIGQADEAMDSAIAAGVSDARIRIE